MENDKYIDESWKESAFKEKEHLNHRADSEKQKSKLFVKESIKSNAGDDEDKSPENSQKEDSEESHNPIEINFLNYITSLGYQALIFLGEIPHPMTSQKEENIGQAKFLIDTLVMIREKTKGNLDGKEENLLNASVYELQMKYIEIINSKKSQTKE